MKKKKVLIFTSAGGGGHTSISKSLQSYLSDSYDVQEAYIFKHTLSSIDFIRIVSCNRFTDEDFVNYLLYYKYYRVFGLLYVIGRWYINRLCRKKINALLKKYLISNKPDLVISIVPLINYSILQVAQDLSIPFIIVPADLDISGYIIDIHNPHYPHFFIVQAYNKPFITDILKKAGISHKNIIATESWPLRPDFFEHKDRDKIKEQMSISSEKSVVMVIMGSQGTHAHNVFIQELVKSNLPLHILALTGAFRAQDSIIDTVTVPSNITISTITFTEHIADFFAISDLVITKTGPNSVCEAIQMNVPCILDCTVPILPWERASVHFVHDNECGESIYNYHDVLPIVEMLLTDKERLMHYKNNCKKISKENCGQKIRKFIDTMMQ